MTIFGPIQTQKRGLATIFRNKPIYVCVYLCIVGYYSPLVIKECRYTYRVYLSILLYPSLSHYTSKYGPSYVYFILLMSIHVSVSLSLYIIYNALPLSAYISLFHSLLFTLSLILFLCFFFFVSDQPLCVELTARNAEFPDGQTVSPMYTKIPRPYESL